MQQLLDLFGQYGQWSVFAVVLLVQLGAPLPALPILLLAGSFAVHDPMLGLLSLILAVIASMIGDGVWYLAGRRYGNRIMQLLCKISMSPDSCVRQTEHGFHRWGVATLVIAKFVPGLATLAPPLSGALGLGRGAFVLFAGIGAVLWAGTWIVVGGIFHQQIQQVLGYVATWGKMAGIVLLGLLALYVAYRWIQRYRLRILAKIARVTVQELADWLKAPEQPLVLDARSELARGLDLAKIQGASLFDATNLSQAAKQLTVSRTVVVYCSCPNDVTALKVAAYLRKKGYNAHALLGGLDAWRAAGFEVEDFNNQ